MPKPTLYGRVRKVGVLAVGFILLFVMLASPGFPGRSMEGTGVATEAETSPPFSPTQTPLPTATTRQLFDGQQAFKHAEAQVNIGFRPTGSEESFKTGDYIMAQLRAFGWKATDQPFVLDIDGTPVKGRNITGSLGSGPVIILGAHYDTRLWADHDPDVSKRREPVMGANDGASGVAALLELARVLGQHYTYHREIRLVFLDAEDNGSIPGWNDWSLGTKYYVQHLDTRPEYVIILDMIGDSDLQIYYENNSMRSAPEIMTALWDVAERLGYGTTFIKQPRFTMIDDHIPFIDQGIRAVDVIDFDYPYWHTVSDTLDKISASSLEKVGRVVQTYLERTGVIK